MNDVERRLKRLGEDAERALPPEMRPRGESLRRIRLRRRLLAGGIALCSAVVVAGGVVVAADGSRDRNDLPPAHETTEEPRDLSGRPERCGVPFEPTYLPPGFSPKPQEGPGGGAPNQPDAPTLVHFAGGRGRFVEVAIPLDGGFDQTRRTGITVLGRPAALGAIHEGYSAEFRIGRCRYELRGYGVTRGELRELAEGLVATDPRAGSYFGAVWPEDTLEEARRGCATEARAHAVFTALQFAAEELRWVEPVVVIEERRASESTMRVRPRPRDVADPGVEYGVRVWMREILPDCWSVVSVSPLAGRRLDLSVGVNGREANIVFSRYGATTASVEFGHGSYTSSTHWHRESGEEVTTLHVSGVARSTGHFLVLLRDSEGDPFAAIGRPLPPGDFAAG